MLEFITTSIISILSSIFKVCLYIIKNLLNLKGLYNKTATVFAAVLLLTILLKAAYAD